MALTIREARNLLPHIKRAIKEANLRGDYMLVARLKADRTKLKKKIMIALTKPKYTPALNDQMYVFKREGVKVLKIISE